jgi:type IV pilus assembly protein PilQ
MNALRGLGLLLLASMMIASCASRSGVVEEGSQGSAGVVISKVELVPDGGGSKLVLSSSREPKYNVFKLQDPERIVVDVIDARIQDGVPSSLAGNELIQEVKVQALEDSLSALVRFEIVLTASTNYLAEITNEGLSVRLFKSGEVAPEMPQNTPIASESPTPEVAASAPEVPKAPEATASSGSSTDLPSVPAPLPVPVPAPVEVPAPVVPVEPPKLAESAPLPLPVPSAPEAKANETKPAEVPAPVKPESETPLAEVKPPQESAEAVASENLKKEETAAMPLAAPAEAIPTEKVKEKKSKKDKGVALKPVADQEIASTLSEGTSLLTELDSKVYTGRRVSLEFQDADAQDIIRLIAEVSKLNIVTGDDVKGKISLKLIDVPWDQALDIILTTMGLDKTQHGNIIRVAPSDKLRKEREVALANDKAAKQLEPLKLKLINVNYAKANDLSARIKNLLSDRGTVDTDDRTNTLIVKDIREHLTRVENLIKALDTQTPQVRIEARIVQANDNFTRDLGIQWGPTLHLDATNSKTRPWQFPRTISGGAIDSSMTLPGWAVDALPGSATAGNLGFRLGSVSDIFQLDLKLAYLETESLGRVVSRPSISVLDNKSANIIQGSKVPFLASGANGTTVSFQNVGIQIDVTPQITSDGSVILKVHTSSNEILSTSVGGNPITTLRDASTEMLVKSGRTAVLGGVFKTSDTSSRAGVPGLYRLPVLGWLFGNNGRKTTREETLVFITPFILNDARASATGPTSESALEH